MTKLKTIKDLEYALLEEDEDIMGSSEPIVDSSTLRQEAIKYIKYILAEKANIKISDSLMLDGGRDSADILMYFFNIEECDLE